MADKDFKVKTGLDLPAPLPLLEGGTGQTTANNALNAMLPSQTTHASKILGTDGTNTTWVNPGAAYQTSAPSNPVTGQLWVDSDETGDSLDPYIIRRKTITATAGQTVFTTDVVFTDGYEQIYYNGVLLVRTTDYTTSGGTNTVTLLQGASAGDTVEIISSTPINLVNTVVTGAANTITSPNASAIPLTIQSAASQTANLLEIKNNTGELRYFVDINGTPHSRAYAADSTSGFNSERYNTGDPVATFSMRGYAGTIASPLSVGADQRIGLLAANAYDGTSLINSSRITFSTDGVVSTGNVPGRITFNTAPVGGGHTERMRIDSVGNVGIGHTAPNSPLEVRSSNKTTDSFGTIFAASNNFSQDNGGSISMGGVFTSDNNQSNISPYVQISGRKENATSGNYAGYMAFSTRANGGGITEKMRITSAGNIGIGMSSPVQRLEVAGNINATGYYGPLLGGTNLATASPYTVFQANTNTKIAQFDTLPDGLYAIYVTWGFADNNAGSQLYWGTSFGGIAGIVSAGGYFNGSATNPLDMNATQHHRTASTLPTFFLGGDQANTPQNGYGRLSLYIRFPEITRVELITVIAKRLF
jgi:hypothetical protein